MWEKKRFICRLRGEVAFTFDEIAVISHNLGISIDQIIGNHFTNRVTFDLESAAFTQLDGKLL